MSIIYFDKIDEIKINELINNEYPIYAHIKEGQNETLEEHIHLCKKYFFKIIDDKKIYSIFEKIENVFFDKPSKDAIILFREMILNTVMLHDMGKVNPCFQRDRLNNNLNIKEAVRYNNSHHSMLSSLLYLDYYFPRIKEFEKSVRNLLLDFMMMNAYVISRHHGQLSSFEQFENKFDDDGEGEKLVDVEGQRKLFEFTYANKVNLTAKNITKMFRIVKNNKDKYSKDILLYRYIYERFMLSILIACDFYSTSEFMDGIEISNIGVINNINEFYNEYKKGDVYKSIRKYEKEKYTKCKDFSKIKDINILRDELFLDSEKKLLENINSNIFYLEAPTGSGKSNTATNLSFKLLEQDKSKNKIFYVYPFNTLVEQNINILGKVFEKTGNILNKIAVINSIEPIKTDGIINKNEEEKSNLEHYKKALLNREFLNYPIVLTTHVTIFKYLFGTSKEDIFPLYQIANSVIVLDEIQSYKNLIWGEIITFLTCYAKLLNIKFIIMSATLPNLDALSLSMGSTIRLIEDRNKYFKNPVFKNRVKVDYSLLSSKNIHDDLYNHVKEKSILGKKILIEFVSKNSAFSFYGKLKNDNEISCDVELMTGDDNINERTRILDKVKACKHIILVATQVVEAGVDIDMDIGYKNVSLFDSEEQFLGRINRSCSNLECIAYFFKLDEAKAIYRGDVRNNSDITLNNKNIRDILIEKKFDKYYEEVIARLKNITGGLNELNINNFFVTDVGELNFIKVADKMKLISDDFKQIAIYLCSNQIDQDGKNLCGSKIWDEYKKTLSNGNMDYAEKRVKLSRIRSEMNNFIYQIKWNENFSYNDRIGELYYIEDGDKFFIDGKFNREKFISGIGDFI